MKRHRGREGKVECPLCGAECESVIHVLWECPSCVYCILYSGVGKAQGLGGPGEGRVLALAEKTSDAGMHN